jgi:hypothetical protein
MSTSTSVQVHRLQSVSTQQNLCFTQIVLLVRPQHSSSLRSTWRLTQHHGIRAILGPSHALGYGAAFLRGDALPQTSAVVRRSDPIFDARLEQPAEAWRS